MQVDGRESVPAADGTGTVNTSVFVASRPYGQTRPSWGPVGLLEHDGGCYRFRYTHGARSLEGFRAFQEMPELNTVYESEVLFPLFASRLLARSRPEYERYLAWSGMDSADPPDPLILLGVAGGRRETDALEVFPRPVPDEHGDYAVKFFAHGIRWLDETARRSVDALEPGQAIALAAEDDNPLDPNAVAIHAPAKCGGERIGYVPRYLAADVRKLAQDCNPGSIRLQVDRVNRGAPLQQRLLCHFKACWPDDFRTCDGLEFEPISSLAPSEFS